MEKELKKIVESLKIGQEFKFQFFKTQNLLIYEDVYTAILVDEEAKLKDSVWFKFDFNLLEDYLESISSDKVLNGIRNNKGQAILAHEGYFLKDVDIKGKVSNFSIKTNSEKELYVKGIEVTQMGTSNPQKKEHGGGVYIKVGDSSFGLLSDKLKVKISKALEPYIKQTEVFVYLQEKLSRELPLGISDDFVLITCSKCSKPEIYSKLEIPQNWYSKGFCRDCHPSMFNSLTEVPHSETMLIHVFSTYNEILQRYVHKGKSVPSELINKIEPYMGVCASREELSVMYRYVNNLVKKRFMPDRYAMHTKLNDIVNKAKELNKKEFEKLIKNIDKFFSETSLYITQQMIKVSNDISSKISRGYLDWYYPNPRWGMETEKHSLFMEKEILYDEINNIMNLYKDVFDITSNHWFIHNIARILKGKTIQLHSINGKFGNKLLQQTKDVVQGTDLEEFVEESYNVVIRNSIAHPARTVDTNEEKVNIYKDGEIAKTYELYEFLLEVNKLLIFHMELAAIKHKLGFESSRDFLGSEGILSLETDFLENLGDQERPYLIINQLSPFKEFSPLGEWWKHNIAISRINIEGKVHVQFSINRPSRYSSKWEVVYQISSHIRKWIDMVLEQGGFVVAHRSCQVPFDTEALEQLTSIPENIYLYRLDEERIHLVESFDELGLYMIDSKIECELKKLLQESIDYELDFPS